MPTAALSALILTCAPAVHPSTLMAVISHESRGNPYAIGINRGKRLTQQPRDAASATRLAQQLQARGVDFDAGLGQINVRNWGWLNLTAATVFDPCTNVAAAARVLSDCYRRALPRHQRAQAALLAALSCYHTGHFQRGLDNGYVQAVAARAGIRLPALSTR